MIATKVLLGVVFLAFLRFLYVAFDFAVPRHYWAIAIVWVAAVVLSAVPVAPAVAKWLIAPCIALSVSESMRIIGRAIGTKVDGSWIIGAGVVSYAIALSADLLRSAVTVSGVVVESIALAGLFGLPLFVSIYLARMFGRTSDSLRTKLVEVEELSQRAIEQERREKEMLLQREHERAQLALLEAENERKAQELEEARQLQLSMLPRSVPLLPGVEIAAYMKPATEVGGDYYDFHVGDDGTLTVAVGDATGHGLKAGTLVTATKGLFNALAHEPDIPRFFHTSSHALKRLNLRYLYMALLMAKVNGNRVRVSAAGMPPVLVYRSARGTVEQLMICGMPLGGPPNFPYREEHIELAPGDTVLLMSDGFPERFNPDGEMLDYDRVSDIFAEVASRPAEAIIDHLVRTGDTWGSSRPQDDDVTFVVLKFRVPEGD